MESRDKFTINENIEISSEKENCFYKTKVLDVNTKSMTIGMPMSKNNLLLLYENDYVVIKRTREDAVYYYSSQILGRRRDDQVPLYQITYPRLSQRLQRRKFIRLPCMLQVNYRCFAAEEKKVDQVDSLLSLEKELCFTHSIDISGGGVKFHTIHDFPLNQILELEIILPEHTIRSRARVVHTGRVKGGAQGNNTGKWAAVEFNDLEEKERDVLIAFIFRKLRERL